MVDLGAKYNVDDEPCSCPEDREHEGNTPPDSPSSIEGKRFGGIRADDGWVAPPNMVMSRRTPSVKKAVKKAVDKAVENLLEDLLDAYDCDWDDLLDAGDEGLLDALEAWTTR